MSQIRKLNFGLLTLTSSAFLLFPLYYYKQCLSPKVILFFLIRCHCGFVFS
uniref:Uncharacterized protein n=1 Tax=Peromyscus maniculatus bairdii TaxID=230844 RepID=A0A8C8UKJ9_PERMB